MGRYVFVCLMLIAITCPKWAVGQQGCGQACQTLNDCEGQLICTNGKCNDDPDVGTHICSATPSPTGGGTCQQSGTLQGKDGNCDTSDGSECCKSSEKYPTYTCSPPVSSQTAAVLTLNGFGDGESGGGASACDGQFHKNSELIVALSTGWFDNRSRCGKQIRISANSKSVLAKVVDECDSTVGCDEEHDFQPPCHNNIVDGSSAVWSALGLNQDQGEVPVTWSDAS